MLRRYILANYQLSDKFRLVEVLQTKLPIFLETSILTKYNLDGSFFINQLDALDRTITLCAELIDRW